MGSLSMCFVSQQPRSVVQSSLFGDSLFTKQTIPTMRDVACDVARGLTFFEMEYANHTSVLTHATPGTDKLTYADTIFPSFVFLSGMHPMSCKRSLQTVGLGVGYNLVKSANSSWLQSADNIEIRPFGILQRTGLSALLLNLAPPPTELASCGYPIAAIALWIALSYGLAEDRRHPFKNTSTSAQTKIDRSIVSSLGAHFKLYTNNIDPEGLLGVLTTSVSMWFGSWVASNDLALNESFITGISLMSFGYMFSYAFPRTCPINKPYWTMSYVLSSSGFSLLKYTMIQALLPVLPSVLVNFLSCTGQRTLELFYLSAVLDRIGIPTGLRQFFNRCLGPLVSDVLSTTFVNLGLGAVAIGLVKFNMRLR